MNKPKIESWEAHGLKRWVNADSIKSTVDWLKEEESYNDNNIGNFLLVSDLVKAFSPMWEEKELHVCCFNDVRSEFDVRCTTCGKKKEDKSIILTSEEKKILQTGNFLERVSLFDKREEDWRAVAFRYYDLIHKPAPKPDEELPKSTDNYQIGSEEFKTIINSLNLIIVGDTPTENFREEVYNLRTKLEKLKKLVK